MHDESKDNRWRDLMAKGQKGDEKSYRVLLEEISVEVRSFCRRRVGYMGLTDDVVQEALITIHKARHTFDPSKKFGPWMFALIRNSMIDQLRKSSRYKTREVFNPEMMEQEASPDTSETDGQKSELEKAIDELPEIYREAVMLIKVQGLTTEEAARKLNVSESAIKVRAHRGVESLKKALKVAS